MACRAPPDLLLFPLGETHLPKLQDTNLFLFPELDKQPGEPCSWVLPGWPSRQLSVRLMAAVQRGSASEPLVSRCSSVLPFISSLRIYFLFKSFYSLYCYVNWKPHSKVSFLLTLHAHLSHRVSLHTDLLQSLGNSPGPLGCLIAPAGERMRPILLA